MIFWSRPGTADDASVAARALPTGSGNWSFLARPGASALGGPSGANLGAARGGHIHCSMSRRIDRYRPAPYQFYSKGDIGHLAVEGNVPRPRRGLELASNSSAKPPIGATLKQSCPDVPRGAILSGSPDATETLTGNYTVSSPLNHSAHARQACVQ